MCLDSILVSIVVPAYNCDELINETLESLLNQTHNNIEIIIVCNGGYAFDSGVFADSRLKICFSDKGVSAARNKGIALSRGAYVAFCDSDDIWLPTKLEVQLEFMLNNSLSVSYTGAANFISGRPGRTTVRKFSKKVNSKRLLVNNPIVCSSVMLEKQYMISNNLKFQHQSHEDYRLWLKICTLMVAIDGIEDVLVLYRIHSGNMTKNKLKSAIWHIQAQKQSGMSFFYIVKGLVLNVHDRLSKLMNK